MLGPNGTGQNNTARTKRAAPAEEQICPSNGSRFYHNARTMSNDFTMFSYRLCVREEACRAGRGKKEEVIRSGLPFGSTTPPACPWQATVSRGRDRASVKKQRAQCAVSKFASGQSPTGGFDKKALAHPYTGEAKIRINPFVGFACVSFHRAPAKILQRGRQGKRKR